jgi:RNA recognition motif-containing protein
LRDFFGELGHGIVNVKFMYDRKTGKQRPFCFVDFDTEERLSQALTMNGQLLKNIEVKMNRAGYKDGTSL